MLEAAAIKAGPLQLIFLSISCAFILLMMGYGLGFGDIQFNGKQVGQLYAPNWTLVYVVLFPPFLGLSAILAQRFNLALAEIARRRIVVDPIGNEVPIPTLLGAWHASLQQVSFTLWGLLIVIVIYESWEWSTTIFHPLRDHNVGNSPVDWTIVAATSAGTTTGTPTFLASVIFSFFSYLYMASTLFIYLSTLVYQTAFSSFVNTLANPNGAFRLVLRDLSIGERLANVGTYVFWSCVLGLCAGFMMRLQAIYLQSDHKLVTDLFLADLFSVIDYFRPTSHASTALSDVPSKWTGFLQIMFTLLALFAVAYLFGDAFEKARQYYLDNIDSPKWRSNMRLTYNKRDIDAVRTHDFLTAIFPKYIPMTVVVVGIVTSAIFIGYGLIFMSTLGYRLRRWSQLQAKIQRNAQINANDSTYALRRKSTPCGV